MRIQETTKTSDYRLKVDASIDDFFKENIAKALIISPHYLKLWRVLHTISKSGGKRIRPEIMLRAYEAFGGTDLESMIPIAVAQELLHISMLIHDDIIDRDDKRHGTDNVAGTYNKLYASTVKNINDRAHYAQSAALLAGDLLISASYQLIAHASIIPQKIIAVQHLLGETIFEAVGGELLDTEASFYDKEISVETISYYKTASYTFVCPLLSGAVLANASKEDQSHLRLVAENLGIAYQFTDDIIGVFGDEQVTGKSAIGDIREGKRTMLVEQFYKSASPDEIVIFEKYYGKKDITNTEAQILRTLLIRSGAKDKVERSIQNHVSRAKIALSKLKLADIHSESLSELITLTTRRNY